MLARFAHAETIPWSMTMVNDTSDQLQGKFVLGNLSEKSTIAVFSEARPIKGLCREQIYRALERYKDTGEVRL
jgi:hypothetical protein